MSIRMLVPGHTKAVLGVATDLCSGSKQGWPSILAQAGSVLPVCTTPSAVGISLLLDNLQLLMEKPQTVKKIMHQLLRGKKQQERY